MLNTDLFSELSRKIFHDLINPASAALNGMELLKYNLTESGEQILEDDTFRLLEMSIKKITAQIAFFRFCYSHPEVEKNENLSVEHIDSIVNDYINFTKLEISHGKDLENLNKKFAILFTNTVLILQGMLPQGAEIYYELIDANIFIIQIKNPTGKINAEIMKDLHADDMNDIKNIQISYLYELLRIYGINREIISEGDSEISINFSNQNQADSSSSVGSRKT